MITVYRSFLLSFLILGAVNPTFGKIISLGPSIAWLSVRGTDNSTAMQFPSMIWLPSSGTLQCLNQPNVTAAATYQFNESGFSVSHVNYTLGAANNISSFADLYGQITFTPMIDITYTISGSFSWSGRWSNGVTLWASLQDITNGIPGTVITNHYYNKSGVQTNVILTVTPSANRPVTGTLSAGRTYEFDYELAVDNNPNSPDIGVATGQAGISFVPQTAVCGDIGHPYPVGDLNQDCYVLIDDIVLLASYWLADWCSEPDWCDRTEISHDGIVNLEDFAAISFNWLSCTNPLAPCNFAP
ncbi:MAG: hypothetical protein JXB18_14220 [Sedimentisphaerales bacterium]|nr:hypothetical protein [Sedimentisphaerales bacterium]